MTHCIGLHETASLSVVVVVLVLAVGLSEALRIPLREVYDLDGVCPAGQTMSMIPKIIRKGSRFSTRPTTLISLSAE